MGILRFDNAVRRRLAFAVTLALAACRPDPVAPTRDPGPKPSAAVERVDAPIRVRIAEDDIELRLGDEVRLWGMGDWDGVGDGVFDAIARSSRGVLELEVDPKAPYHAAQTIVEWADSSEVEVIWGSEATVDRVRLRQEPGFEPKAPECSPLVIYTGGRGLRVETRSRTKRTRLGRIDETEELPELVETAAAPVCGMAILEVAWRIDTRWEELSPIIVAASSTGITSVALAEPRIATSPDYSPYEWSKDLARLRIEQVWAGGNGGPEGFREYWTIGPARGEAMFDAGVSATNGFQPESFVVELPPGRHGVDVTGSIAFGGVMPDCGTDIDLPKGAEVTLFHNYLYRACTLAPKPEPAQREVSSHYRRVRFVNDARRGTRKPWQITARAADGRSPFLDYVVPARLREFSMEVPAVRLEIDIHEFDDLALPGCRGGSANCRPEGKPVDPCRLELEEEIEATVTYRAGKSCDADKSVRSGR